jgi:crossover junction endodeoxyribonuclease RuvC
MPTSIPDSTSASGSASDPAHGRGNAPVSHVTRILGIDPGSRVTGFGVIDSDGRHSVHVASGCIRTGDGELRERLKIIFAGIGSVVSQWQPATVAVERVFLSKNADSALKLGHARAAAICATLAADLPVHEYAARQVKQAVVGTGAAEKTQVARMVSVLLNYREVLAADAADALAVALCHAHSDGLRGAVGHALDDQVRVLRGGRR